MLLGRTILRAACLACLGGSAGCVVPAAGPQSAGATAAATRRVTPPLRAALNAAPRQLRQIALRVYMLDLPRGQVSSNEELWRRIDEQALAPGAYDVLYANGVRVGVAPVTEIEHVSDTLGITDAPTRDVVAMSLGRQVEELEVATNIDEQTLFWFDAAKRHKGQTFQDCENLLSVGFEPTPGRLQSVRLSIAPVVRALRQRTVITSSGEDRTVTRVRDQTLFDLSLRADVPLGWFLIIAPSDETRWQTSLGRQFFCHERDGELYERVYVIIPRINAVRAG